MTHTIEIRQNNTGMAVEPCALCGRPTGRHDGTGRIPLELMTADGGMICRACAAEHAPDASAWLDRYHAGGAFRIPHEYARQINDIAERIQVNFRRGDSHLGDALHHQAVDLFAEAFGLRVSSRHATMREIRNEMRHSHKRDAERFNGYQYDHKRFLRYGRTWAKASRYAGVLSFTYGPYDEHAIRTIAADDGLVVWWPDNARDWYCAGSTRTYLWTAPDGDLHRHLAAQEGV